MAYSTPERVRAVLVQTGDATPSTDGSTPAVFTDAQLQVAIDDADALLDATLGLRYTVPFDPVPNLLVSLSAAYAAYFATLTHRKTKNLEERDPAQLRYSQARGIVNDLLKGDLIIPGVDPISTDVDAYAINPYTGNMFLLEDFDVKDVPIPKGWAV